MLAPSRKEGRGGVQATTGAAAVGTAVGDHAPARHACQVGMAASLQATQAAVGTIQQRLNLHHTMTMVSTGNGSHTKCQPAARHNIPKTCRDRISSDRMRDNISFRQMEARAHLEGSTISL